MWRCIECEDTFIEPGAYCEDPGYSHLGGGQGYITILCCPSCGSECIEEFDEDEES